MDTAEYITSGTLEFYVYGLLSEQENIEVNELAKQHESVRAEILSIEKAVINLSHGVSPHLSAENYEKIRQKLIEKHSNDGVVQLQPKRGANPYIGWAAAVILMFGLAFQYYKYNEVTKEVEAVTVQKSKFEQLLATTQQKNTETEKALAIVRDNASSVVTLAGQEIAPTAYAKAYVNKVKKETYIDLAGLAYRSGCCAADACYHLSRRLIYGLIIRVCICLLTVFSFGTTAYKKSSDTHNCK